MCQFNCDNSQVYLNHCAGKITNQDITVYVHYWGANPRHLYNFEHCHSFFEICYVLDGEGEYWEDGRCFALIKDTLYLSRPGHVHQIKSKEGLYILYVAFEIIEAETSAQAIERFRHLAVTNKYFLRNINQTSTAYIWKALMCQASENQVLAEQVIRTLSHSLILSFQQLFTEYQSPSNKSLPSKNSALLNQIQLFIRDNLSRPIKMSDLSTYFHISERQLSRLFNEILHESLPLYIRKERIKMAATLLREINLSLKQIASETGFDSIHYFTRVFKSEMGVPPGIYRRNMSV